MYSVNAFMKCIHSPFIPSREFLSHAQDLGRLG